MGTICDLTEKRQLIVTGKEPVNNDPVNKILIELELNTFLPAQIAIAEKKKAGTYGICIDCQNPIPYERLEVAPHAERCIRCQTAHENNCSD